MSLASDLLSTRGRMSPGAFLKSALILIVIGAVLSLLQLVSPILGSIATVVSLVMIYPWIAIWVKRLHDAGQSGWMVLLVILIYLILLIGATLVLMGYVAPGFWQAAMSGDPAATQTAMTEMQSQLVVPSTICSTVISVVVVFLGNLMLRSEPGVNRFGEPVA